MCDISSSHGDRLHLFFFFLATELKGYVKKGGDGVRGERYSGKTVERSIC